MPIVPTFDREDLPQPMQTGAQADVEAAGLPGDALARFGTAGVDTVTNLIHADNYDKVATHSANFAIKKAQDLDAAKLQAAKTGDYKGVMTAFNTQMAADQAQELAAMPTQRARDALALHTKSTMLDLTRAANSYAMAGERTTWQSNTQSNLDKLSSSSYLHPETADTNYGIGLGIIKGAQAAGIGGDTMDWQQIKDNWGKQNYGAVVRHQIDNDPQGALSALQAGKYNFALHSEDVENLSRQAQVQIDRAQQKELMAQSRALAMEQRQEIQAARVLRQTQATNEASMLADAYQGKTIDPGHLADAVRAQAITPEGATAILRGQEGQDDPMTTLHLYSQLGMGNLQRTDITTAVAAHQIKASTGVELMRGLNERDKSGDDQVERRAFATLKTALSGGPLEQGINVFGDKTAQATAAWVQAQGEWNRRAIVNHEDPQSVLSDMMPRFAPTITVPTWLPTPMAGAVTNDAEVGAAYLKTKALFEAGKLSPDQYHSQANILVDYSNFYREQASRDAAAKSVRPSTKQPGAAPVLTPVTPE